MKKIIIVLLVIISSWYWFVQFSKYLEKQYDISVNEAIDWRVMFHLTNLDEWLKQFESEKAEYPSKNNFDIFYSKRYIMLEKKDFLKEFDFMYEVSEDLKSYKVSALINDKKRAFNDWGIDNNRFEKWNNIEFNNYKYKIILWEDNKIVQETDNLVVNNGSNKEIIVENEKEVVEKNIDIEINNIKIENTNYCFYKDECLDENFDITQSWSMYIQKYWKIVCNFGKNCEIESSNIIKTSTWIYNVSDKIVYDYLWDDIFKVYHNSSSVYSIEKRLIPWISFEVKILNDPWTYIIEKEWDMYKKTTYWLRESDTTIEYLD